MRITLTNLPWDVCGRKGVRAGSRWPFTIQPEKDGRIYYVPFPFFLAYATSLLKKNGQQASLIDAVAEEIAEESWINKVVSGSPELLVVETSTPSFEHDLRIIRNIRSKIPHCQIALSGPHVSVFAGQILTEYDDVDYLLIGEYEFTLFDLIKHLETKSGVESVLGLVYRNNGKVVTNPARPTLENLDLLPWPQREAMPMHRYNDGFCDLPQPNVQMWASRGCPYSCIFCLWPQALYKEHRYRKRNPKDVVDEMEYLINHFNFKAVYFDDDVFNVDRDHVLGICSEMKKRAIQIPWAAMARADLMDQGVLEAMAESGLYAIKYGVESANAEVLVSIRKNMDLDKTKKIIQTTKALGVKVHLTFCVGLPGETPGTLKETADFIKEVRPDSCQCSFATPFPGTEYFRNADARGDLLSKDWSKYDGNQKCIVKTAALSPQDLEAARIQFIRA